MDIRSLVILLVLAGLVSAEKSEARSNRGDIPSEQDNIPSSPSTRFSRDDFILNDSNNATFYLDLPRSEGDQGELFESKSDRANKTHITGRSSRALDLDHYLGGSRNPRKEGNRESRILNDERDDNSNSNNNNNNGNKPGGLAIQGFIPIVSLSGQVAGSQSIPTKASQNGYQNEPANNYQEEGYLPQGYAGPNDAKFLGAALHGLSTALKSKSNYAQQYDSYGGPPTGLGGFPGLGGAPVPQSPGPARDCVCVPFYMCKNGFLEQRSNSNKNHPGNPAHQHHHRPNDYVEELANAQSVLNQFAIPAQLASYYRQKTRPATIAQESQNNLQYQVPPRLPIDERSVDGSMRQDAYMIQSNETTPQYTSEVLGRIFGSGSGSRNCGVLRTCCRIIPEYQTFEVPAQLFPQQIQSFQGQDQYGLAQPYNPSQSLPYQGGIIQPQPHYTPYGGNQPSKRFQPGSIDITTSLIRPKPFQQQGYAGRPVRPSIKNHQPLPVRPGRPLPPPHHYQPSHIANPNPSASYNIDASLGQCGVRHAVGIHGRVQNLQYHKSSTEFGEYPWQAAILKRLGPADSLYVCGGTLISSQWIATAAHCIKTNRAEDLKARLGEWDVHRDDEFYPHVEKFIDEIIIHPEYYPGNLVNDIALIRLESPVDLNTPNIVPACIPSSYENFAGHRCWVTGWGKDSFGTQGEYQSVLKEVDVPILSHDDCEQTLRQTRLGPYYQLHPGFLCAGGEPGKDACEGDGGSPLICEVGGVWKVAGLVSWGIGCGQPGVPGVYVNVGHYHQWIESVTGKYAKNSENNLQDPYQSGIISERSNSGQISINGTTETRSRSGAGSEELDHPTTFEPTKESFTEKPH